ncbi:hypothetical protein [Streptomyces sp. CA2R101]|uniref:hypothetical protein n=1 Tax=Streptomyces sp. CA2R101 TaxID=3120152 RepID=UPI0030089483
MPSPGARKRSRSFPSTGELSVGAWLRGEGARPAVVLLWEIGQLTLAGGSYERTSLLAALRKHAAVPGGDPYAYEDWEGLRGAEGSATVALRMAAEPGAVRTGRDAGRACGPPATRVPCGPPAPDYIQVKHVML